MCLQKTDKLYKPNDCTANPSVRGKKHLQYQGTRVPDLHYSVPCFTILPLLSDPVDNVAMETAKLAKNDRNKVYFVMRTKSSAWKTYQALRAHAIIGQLINSVDF